MRGRWRERRRPRHLGPRHVKRLASPDMPFSQEARFGAASAARSCVGFGIESFLGQGVGIEDFGFGSWG